MFYALAFRFIIFSIDIVRLSSEIKAQDVTTINQKITFKRGTSSVIIKKQIRKGTSHQYRIRAREGQNMTVILNTGRRTSFTVLSLNQGILEGADETRWCGMLNETGEYLIVIGTDVTANYTLEVYVK